MVFGLLRLLGREYRPQLADLPDAKLWRIDAGAHYGPLDAAARGRIDLGRVRRHWPDLCRLIASVHTGVVSAHDVIRMLAPGGRPAAARRKRPAARAGVEYLIIGEFTATTRV